MNIVKMTTLSKAIQLSNTIPSKICIVFFTELEQINKKFVWKHKRLSSQNNLEKEEWNWRNHTLTSNNTEKLQ